jgi:hypothetical protein
MRFVHGHAARTSRGRELAQANLRRGSNGADNPAWKGDDVGYPGVHAWVRAHKEKTGTCSECGANGATEWANVDHQYRRDLDDYRELCRSCHRAYDFEHNNIPVYGRRAA